MADLNIPNLNKKNEKYLFKNKLSLRRKSKRRLFSESSFMLILSFGLAYINYLIPNKILIFKNFLGNLEKLFLVILSFFSYLFQIVVAIFIVLSLIMIIILLLGSIYRIFKILKRKTKSIQYK